MTKTSTIKTPAAKASTGKSSGGASPGALTEGQRAYEAKRAAKAGMSLERWLDAKQKQQEAEARAKLKAAAAPSAPKKPGFFGRLIERASKPL